MQAKDFVKTAPAVTVGVWVIGFTATPDARAEAGNCAQFNAAAGSYMYVASTEALKLTAPMTIEVWVNPFSCGGEWSLILGKQLNPVDANPWYSYRFYAASASASEKGFPRRVRYNVAPVSGGEYSVVSTTTVPVSAWTHIAGVYDGTNITVYINGVPESYTPLASGPRNADLGLYVGRAPWTGNNNYNGQMDEIRVWCVARTQGQLQDAMNRSLRGDETGLAAYWTFNDAPGSSTADDTSTNSHVGTFYGGAAIVAGSTAPVYPAFPCTFQTDGTPGATVNDATSVTQFVRDGGTSTAVTAHAPDWHEFAGWTGDFVGMANPLILTNVITHVNVTAHFTALLAAQGTPHWWMAQHGLTNGGWTFDQAETNNPDNDPFRSVDEYICDTVPTNPASYFCITGVSPASPVTIHFQSSSNRLYAMRGVSNLLSGVWTDGPGAGPRAGAGGADSMTDTNEPAKGPFYRLSVELP